LATFCSLLSLSRYLQELVNWLFTKFWSF
jgi:hypothetical protein